MDRWLGVVLQRRPVARIEIDGEFYYHSEGEPKKTVVDTFPALIRWQARTNKRRCGVWMRNIVLPKKERRRDVAKVWRSEKDRTEAGDRHILEFPPSTSPRTAAKVLKAEGWYSPKTTTYYIEYRIRRLRVRVHRENVQSTGTAAR